MRIFLLALALTAGCRVTSPVVQRLPRPAAARHVVVVTLDGVRWQEIFDGVDARRARRHGVPQAEIGDARQLVPEMYRRFVDHGTALGAGGQGVVASGPSFVSLPGYRELFSGRRSTDCADNRCPPVSRPTLLDELDGELAVIASWEALERASAMDLSRVIVSAGRHHGATRERVRVTAAASNALDAGAAAGAWPGHDDYRPDAHTAALALAYLEARGPRLLFVGLGDTDEYAHRGDYPRYLAALREADAFIARLFATLDDKGMLPETVVLVTTDHGRADDFANHGRQPESSRVFLLACGPGVPAQGIVPVSAERRLADIAPTLRHLLGRPERETGIAELMGPRRIETARQMPRIIRGL